MTVYEVLPLGQAQGILGPCSLPIGIYHPEGEAQTLEHFIRVYVDFLTPPACLVSFAYFILRVVVSEFPPNCLSVYTKQL